MTAASEPVEAYLDELLRRLQGAPRDIRRMLNETEAHLYAAVEDGIARGLDAAAAADLALTRFGPEDEVARQWNVRSPAESPLRFGRRLTAELAPLVSVGLVAIGVSGLLARIMVRLWGLRFMFADPPGTRYTGSQCHYWLVLHPRAPSCTAAYLAESLADGTQARYAAGILGVGLLAILAIIRRRQGQALFAPPTLLAALTGTALFILAAVTLAGVAIDDLRVSSGNGAGQWFSAAIVALPLAAWYAWQFLRLGRRVPIAT